MEGTSERGDWAENVEEEWEERDGLEERPVDAEAATWEWGEAGEAGEAGEQDDGSWLGERGRSLSAEENERVKAFHRDACALAERLTPEMEEVVVAAGGVRGKEYPLAEPSGRVSSTSGLNFHRVHLGGIEHAVKEVDSLRRKVATVGDGGERGGERFDEELAGIKDAVRYTVVLPDERYHEGKEQAIAELTGKGFTNLETKDSWDDAVYRGVNSTWRDSESSMAFEVQFHTPVSFLAKQYTHPIYKEQRLLPREDQENHRIRQGVFTHHVPVPGNAATNRTTED
ncbi:hypothetical protein [Streptomyces sp. NPDC085479]|uniref:hypothetical protein n=1 Tax=Streptomyces sp. NPDC085479 TaxID=3365726 RepID=UPI0037D7FBBF